MVIQEEIIQYVDIMCTVAIHTHTVFMNMIVVRSMTEKENRREENNNNKKTIIIDTYTRIRTCSVERKHNHETVITAKMLPKSQDHHN